MTAEERRKKVMQIAAEENAQMLKLNGGYSNRFGQKTVANTGRKLSAEIQELFKLIKQGISVTEAAKEVGIELKKARRAVRDHENMRGYMY